jgi:peptidoglycan/LPS O-acetylase OafA/YrhL
MHTAPIPTPHTHRNAGIDALRGFCILLVISLHIGLRVPLRGGMLEDVFPRWFLNALNFNGYQAVFMFFTISGFLIATQSIERWGSLANISVGDFYARRAARILPLLLALIVVLAIMHGLSIKHFAIERDDQTLARAAISALSFHLNWYEGTTSYLPASWDVLWSLSIEEAFYVGFPLLCLVLRSRTALWLLLAVIACSLPLWKMIVMGDLWNEKHYMPGFAAIAMGVLGALYVTGRAPLTTSGARVLCGLGFVGIIAALFGFRWLRPFVGDGRLLMVTFSTNLLIIGLWQLDRSGVRLKLPGMAWLQSCGRLCYEMYLTHMFIVWPAVLLFKASGSAQWWGGLIYPPTFFVCWLVARWVARFFTLPMERKVRAMARVG